jgi:hypothetical protein
MTTRAQLADRAQNVISDAGAAKWSQAIIEEWVQDALRDYSRSFPRVQHITVETFAATRVYAISGDFFGILSFEYPILEDPPHYIQRFDSQDPAFYEGDYYDLIYMLSVPVIILSQPQDDQSFTCHIYTTHVAATSPAVLTVPGGHEDILIQYIVWRAMSERKALQAHTPTSNSSLLMAQLNQLEKDARRIYERMLNQALSLAPTSPTYSPAWNPYPSIH